MPHAEGASTRGTPLGGGLHAPRHKKSRGDHEHRAIFGCSPLASASGPDSASRAASRCDANKRHSKQQQGRRRRNARSIVRKVAELGIGSAGTAGRGVQPRRIIRGVLTIAARAHVCDFTQPERPERPLIAAGTGRIETNSAGRQSMQRIAIPPSPGGGDTSDVHDARR